jgi:hypothetical protein
MLNACVGSHFNGTIIGAGCNIEHGAGCNMLQPTPA